ncbi:MAG TPA: glycerol-3-phosphate responsive antiterminator [Candidatus Limnocylindrales bacterium]|jgi:glycerol-3-phosphate responsive antiterminator
MAEGSLATDRSPLARHPLAPDPGRPHMPRVLVAQAGRHMPKGLEGLNPGLMLRDIDLATVVECAANAGPALALDFDTVHGLNADEAAVDFVVQWLGIAIVLTRRPAIAARVADLGGLGLVHCLALDSTGLRRSLAEHPRRPGVGTVITPGLVLMHMSRAELDLLPHPVLAYGLIGSYDEALSCLRLAESIALSPSAAEALAEALSSIPQPNRNRARGPLTTILAEE